MANFVSFVILLFLLYGRRLGRRNPRLHGQWMTGVIAADFALIGYLTFARHAMDKVNSGMPWYLGVHLIFAIATVILYLYALVIGWRLLSGYSHPGAMWRLDRWIVRTRTLTLLTSLALAYVS